MERKTGFVPFGLTTRGRYIEFDRPVVMGILNATPDSFYDGGRYTDEEAIVARAQQIVAEGADVVDIGVVSSRPGAKLLPPEEEARRLSAAVRLVRQALPQALISVDTCFALPARCAIEAGADMVNDIGGLDTDEAMLPTVAELQVPYILMHGAAAHLGLPTADGDRQGDIVDRVVRFLSDRLDRLYRQGVKDVWIDPGFGFGKDARENHELLHRLDELTRLFREPLLAALSRKRMVYEVLGGTAAEALTGTVVLDTMALDRGARAVRVHDVREAAETVKLMTYTDML